MTLYEGKIGQTYQILGIHLEQSNIARRLEALGVNEMASVTMLNKKRAGACVVKVRGTRLALGRHIIQGIDVKEADIGEGN
jgi:ferrous iron transport protein A